MKFQIIKKWFLRFILLTLVTSIFSLLWIDYEMTKMYGGHTKIVDHTQFNFPQQHIALKNVNVLSSDGKRMLADHTIIIKNGKIISLGIDVEISQGIKIIDTQGKYLIPGLVDSHVHLWESPNDLLLYIANGVTQISELNGSDEHLLWKEEIKQGRIGPNMFVASSRLNSNSFINSIFSKWFAKITSIYSEGDAKSVVQEFVEKGYDAIKIYTLLSNDNFQAVNDAAKNSGIQILGHIPIGIGFDRFWHSNLKDLAHIEELVKELDREFGGYSSSKAGDFLNHVNERSEEIAEKLVKNNISVVSTLWLMESFAIQKADLNSKLNEVELAYANPGITEGTVLTSRALGWLEEVNTYRLSGEYTSKQLKSNRIYWDTYAEANKILLRAMILKGVKVMAGTDANVPVAVPGFSMHDELKSLNNAGLTPAQALKTATITPGERMKIKSGKISIGYNADLVLLNNNPLNNIAHTKSIDSVIINGRLINRKNLDKILAAVKQANDKSRKADISAY